MKLSDPENLHSTRVDKNFLMGNRFPSRNAIIPPSDHISVAKILRPWGLNGQLKVDPLSDFPNRFKVGQEFFIGPTKFLCNDVRQRSGKIILKLAGIETKEEANKFQGALLTIHQSEAHELPEGTFYHHEIEGLDVWTDTDYYLGKITEIITTASNDVYVVRHTKQEILIPATPDVIKSIDLKSQNLTINVIPGLFEN